MARRRAFGDGPAQWLSHCDSGRLASEEIAVVTEARTYLKRAPLQAGISGIIGLIMVTSGCPVMDRLRPMVRTHIPFSTLDETTYRALSMYLLSQYFVRRRGGTPNWDLSGLTEVYGEVRKVNKAFVKRLHTLQIEDASLNAIVNLDVFASFTSMNIATAQLEEVEQLFAAYFPAAGSPPAPPQL